MSINDYFINPSVLLDSETAFEKIKKPQMGPLFGTKEEMYVF